MTTHALDRRTSRRALPALLVAVTVLLALAGAALTASLVARGAGAPESALPAGPFAVAQDIPASFGFLAVEHAERVRGLSADELGGRTHGINGYVPPDKLQVQASVTLTNVQSTPFAYRPSWFRLVTAKDAAAAATARGVAPTAASIRDGELQPDAAVDGRLSFVVPRDGRKLFLLFSDPGRSRPVVIDLRDAAPKRLTPAERARLAGHGH